ncbi:LOW QUALITY PROTEIN: zinc finger protein 395-like [Anomalospiza imberbis]|uniref:LOW QUALITY PROTEIN: zinc finger protein 395-like n=1 Tax=Anomalospiza imberbis TaxID=187417 RepID=UPI00358FE79B
MGSAGSKKIHGYTPKIWECALPVGSRGWELPGFPGLSSLGIAEGGNSNAREIPGFGIAGVGESRFFGSTWECEIQALQDRIILHPKGGSRGIGGSRVTPKPIPNLFQVPVTSLDEQIQGFPACWRAQDPLQAPSLPTSSIPERSVSSNIDVPKRRSDAAVEMDEMVAAMVLTSLSCSPALRSPPCGLPPSQAAGDPWKDGGDVSDSGSSTTSGHWSSAGSATASPPHCPGGATASPPHCPGTATASPPHSPGGATADDGFDTDPEPSATDEPAPRRRKNSAKLMFKCLWPGCGKVLRSGVGIKRHIRTQHLGSGSVESMGFIPLEFLIPAGRTAPEREEDFYYTELRVPKEPAPGAATGPLSPLSLLSPVPPLSPVPAGPCPALPPSSSSPAQASLAEPLAPGSFWHIQADHAYQALPSIQIPVSPHIFTSISWAAATSPLPSLSPARSRSLSLGDPRPPPSLQPQLLVASPPRAALATRKIRGEAKKCRKVYGIEHREQWCTACRWKKAWQRFLD